MNLDLEAMKAEAADVAQTDGMIAITAAAVLALIERLEDERVANVMLLEENDRLQAKVAALEGRLRAGVTS